MLWRDWSPGWSPEAADLDAVKQALAQPGVKAAALGYYRSAFNEATPGRSEAQQWAGTPIRAPTLGLAGETDGCISAEMFKASMPPALFAGVVTVETIPGAGHFLQLEAPAHVNAAIVSWLARHR